MYINRYRVEDFVRTELNKKLQYHDILFSGDYILKASLDDNVGKIRLLFKIKPIKDSSDFIDVHVKEVVKDDSYANNVLTICYNRILGLLRKQKTAPITGTIVKNNSSDSIYVSEYITGRMYSIEKKFLPPEVLSGMVSFSVWRLWFMKGVDLLHKIDINLYNVGAPILYMHIR